MANRRPAARDRAARYLPFALYFLVILGVQAALPRGAFGSFDILVRALVAGVAVGLTSVLVQLVERRRRRSPADAPRG